jgi:UDP-N-acetylmuramyl pentapeptide phosphotransferase/UDP-N-acetylglucosamine-1-phosphate transferase
MVGICILIAITYVAYKNNDLEIMYASLTFTGAVIGFFTYNYPRGLIFLGDGGAYLIGFVIACLSCLLVIRNDAISPWFPLLLNIYPIYETIFSIWRRKIYQKTNPSFPDRMHLHTLIYRRFLKRKYLRQKVQPSCGYFPVWLYFLLLFGLI